MNQLLDKFLGNHPPITSTAQACQFADYFNAKIEQIYSDMSCHNCNTLDVDINVVKSSCASKFRKFEPLSLAGLKAIIESMPSVEFSNPWLSVGSQKPFHASLSNSNLY